MQSRDCCKRVQNLPPYYSIVYSKSFLHWESAEPALQMIQFCSASSTLQFAKILFIVSSILLFASLGRIDIATNSTSLIERSGGMLVSGLQKVLFHLFFTHERHVDLCFSSAFISVDCSTNFLLVSIAGIWILWYFEARSRRYPWGV